MTDSPRATEVWAESRDALGSYLRRFGLSSEQVSDVVAHCGEISTRIELGELPHAQELRKRISSDPIRRRSTIRAYLYSSAKNEALRLIKSNAAMVSAQDFDEGTPAASHETEVDSATVLRDYLLSLSPRDRVLVFERLHGAPWSEIVDKVGRSESTARRTFDTHMAKMRDLISEDPD